MIHLQKLQELMWVIRQELMTCIKLSPNLELKRSTQESKTMLIQKTLLWTSIFHNSKIKWVIFIIQEIIPILTVDQLESNDEWEGSHKIEMIIKGSTQVLQLEIELILLQILILEECSKPI